MRFFFMIYHYLTNNRELINRLADSKPLRFAARTVVSALNKTGTLHLSSKAIDNPRELLTVLRQALKSIKDKRTPPQKPL